MSAHAHGGDGWRTSGRTYVYWLRQFEQTKRVLVPGDSSGVRVVVETTVDGSSPSPQAKCSYQGEPAQKGSLQSPKLMHRNMCLKTHISIATTCITVLENTGISYNYVC